MVKFSFENLNLQEMIDYIAKLESDIRENERDLTHCKNYVYTVNLPKLDDESDEEYRIRNIKQHFLDKQNEKNLLKYSRKKKQLTKKLIDLEIYLIDIGIIVIIEDEIEDENLRDE